MACSLSDDSRCCTSWFCVSAQSSSFCSCLHVVQDSDLLNSQTATAPPGDQGALVSRTRGPAFDPEAITQVMRPDPSAWLAGTQCQVHLPFANVIYWYSVVHHMTEKQVSAGRQRSLSAPSTDCCFRTCAVAYCIQLEWHTMATVLKVYGVSPCRQCGMRMLLQWSRRCRGLQRGRWRWQAVQGRQPQQASELPGHADARSSARLPLPMVGSVLHAHVLKGCQADGIPPCVLYILCTAALSTANNYAVRGSAGPHHRSVACFRSRKRPSCRYYWQDAVQPSVHARTVGHIPEGHVACNQMAPTGDCKAQSLRWHVQNNTPLPEVVGHSHE